MTVISQLRIEELNLKEFEGFPAWVDAFLLYVTGKINGESNNQFNQMGWPLQIIKTRNCHIGNFANVNRDILEKLSSMLDDGLSIHTLENEAEHYLVPHQPNCYEKIMFHMQDDLRICDDRELEDGYPNPIPIFFDDEEPEAPKQYVPMGKVLTVEISIIRSRHQHSIHTSRLKFQIKGTENLNWSIETSIRHSDKFALFSPYLDQLCRCPGYNITNIIW